MFSLAVNRCNFERALAWSFIGCLILLSFLFLFSGRTICVSLCGDEARGKIYDLVCRAMAAHKDPEAGAGLLQEDGGQSAEVVPYLPHTWGGEVPLGKCSEVCTPCAKLSTEDRLVSAR